MFLSFTGHAETSGKPNNQDAELLQNLLKNKALEGCPFDMTVFNEIFGSKPSGYDPDLNET